MRLAPVVPAVWMLGRRCSAERLGRLADLLAPLPAVGRDEDFGVGAFVSEAGEQNPPLFLSAIAIGHRNPAASSPLACAATLPCCHPVQLRC